MRKLHTMQYILKKYEIQFILQYWSGDNTGLYPKSARKLAKMLMDLKLPIFNCNNYNYYYCYRKFTCKYTIFTNRYVGIIKVYPTLRGCNLLYKIERS